MMRFSLLQISGRFGFMASRGVSCAFSGMMIQSQKMPEVRRLPGKSVFFLIGFLSVIVAAAGMEMKSAAAETDALGNRIYVFQDTDDLLRNPGKGLVAYGRCESWYDDAYYDMCAVDYNRFEWSEIEPAEGEYRWDIIDEYIEDAVSHGLKFAFGVMNVNVSTNHKYVTPEWVFDAGAEGRRFLADDSYSTKHISVCPVWTDPVFLEKLNDFVRALGEKYNGNENIVYIDIRSYGNWGEQHISGLQGSGIPAVTSQELKEDFIMPYLRAFPDTLLVNACNEELYADVYEWAIRQGCALRRDGIMGFSDGSECLQAFGKVPAIYELGLGLETYLARGTWNMDELAADIEIGKPSYLEFTYGYYQESADDFAKFANRIGYYFRIKKAAIPEYVRKDSILNFEVTFKNDGVAPLYENAVLKFGFFDEKGQLVKTVTSDEDPKTWQPGEKKICQMTVEPVNLKPGEYTVTAGLFLNEEDPRPAYQFGSKGKNKDNWYWIGEVRVTD